MKSFSIFVSLFFMVISTLKGQEAAVYYPKGDPSKWNVELSPFLWLPWATGGIAVGNLQADFSASPIDLLKKLRGAFLFNVDVSHGRFITSASYVFLKLGSESVLRTNYLGEPSLIAYPDLKMQLLNYIVGTRIKACDKLLIDPFVGFRYVNIHPTINVHSELYDTTYTLDSKFDFWDPILGIRVNYFPKPRVPITLYGDIGGFSAGSKFSWNVGLKTGYSISPLIDIFGGVHALGYNYIKTSDNGRVNSMKTALFGLDMGMTFLLPHRYRDPDLYKTKTGKEKS